MYRCDYCDGIVEAKCISIQFQRYRHTNHSEPVTIVKTIHFTPERSSLPVISTVMRAHARIRIRCERVQCEHMRAYANARIRIALHANAFLMRHATIRIRYLGVFRVRYARICAHSHAMRAHSHRMRSHSHRMRSHRMRMRAFKGNLCVSGTVMAWCRQATSHYLGQWRSKSLRY